jgi:hypothetical protein
LTLSETRTAPSTRPRPQSATFNRIWRTNAYRGEFPEEFAHISFLTLSEAQRMLYLLAVPNHRIFEDAIEEHGNRWVVMADPEGNEFCARNAGQSG